MPELPEVETTIRGLAPFLENSLIKKVTLNRKNLRFDFPKNFAKKLEGQKIINISRRAKYLLFNLSNDSTWISHLGMSGNFRIIKEGDAHNPKKHDHVEITLSNNNNKNFTLIYSDPRRFGFMDLTNDIFNNKFLAKLGVEPLGNQFNVKHLTDKLAKSNSSIKSALLNQSIIAGLGNIYVCEALWRAGIHPSIIAKTLVSKNDKRLEILTPAITDILQAAIKAGGSTLKDFHNVKGEQGYFQHSFDVYGREGEKCNKTACAGIIKRTSQSGRSSFYCEICQK